MSKKENKVKWYYGPIAAYYESMIMHPIETLKVIKQSDRNINIKNYMKNKNFIHLYKGYLPFLSGMVVKYGIRFSAISKLKDHFNSNDIRTNFFCGIISGFSETIFTTPFELIKTRQQTDKTKRGYISTIKNIYEQKGLKSFYRGYLSTSIRQSINQSLNLSVYYGIRNREDWKITPLNTMFLGMFSGSCGPIVNNSFDVVKTRFMNKKYNLKYKTMKCAFKDIIKNEGIIYLMTSGLGLRILRVGVGQAIVFNIIEKLVEYEI